MNCFHFIFLAIGSQEVFLADRSKYNELGVMHGDVFSLL